MHSDFYGDTPTDQMLPECQAMATYALSAGKEVPGAVMEDLARAALALQYLKAGTPLPDQENLPKTTPEVAETLSTVHGQLCTVIAPAKPRTILILKEQEHTRSFFSFLGPLAISRGMMAVSILCLALFIEVSLSVWVDGEPSSLSFFKNEGIDLFYNILFLLSAAGLGASFAGLFQLNKYICQGTYDPKYDASYWNRFLLGLIAGMIMAFFIPVESLASDPESNWKSMGKPLLALLGGFSSSAVYRILNRIIASMESVVKGDPSDEIRAREQTLKSQVADKTNRAQLDLAGKLSDLRAQMGSDTDPKVLAALDKIQNQIYKGNQASSALDDPLPGSAAPSEPKEQQQEAPEDNAKEAENNKDNGPKEETKS